MTHRAAAAAARSRLKNGIAAVSLPLLAGCHAALLEPAGPVSRAERLILLDAVAIMLAIVLTVIIATIGFAIWFRAGNAKARYRNDWTFSGEVEFVTWSIPILVILFLGGIAWIGAHDLSPSQPLKPADTQQAGTQALDVDVVAMDWKWLFIYPKQNVASVNRLAMPVGVPVHFHITSSSVMNAFFIPRLGSMIYAMNGMEAQLYLRADQPGDYRGISAQYSGAGFADMTFTATALPPAQFQAWIAHAHDSGTVLDRSTYQALAQPSEHTAPTTYRSVAPGLFQAVLTQTIPPAPGPSPDQPDKSVTPRGKD